MKIVADDRDVRSLGSDRKGTVAIACAKTTDYGFGCSHCRCFQL